MAPVLRTFALVALLLAGPAAAEADEANPVGRAAGLDSPSAVLEDEANQKAFQLGIWSYDVIVGGQSRPGLVMRFEPGGLFDGTEIVWTREGKKVETNPVSGTWTLTGLDDMRWRVDLEVRGGKRSAIFRRLDPDRVLNEHTGRVVKRVPHYADS